MKYLVWGTGRYADCLIANAKEIVKDIVGFIETETDIKDFCSKKVYNPEEIRDLDYDMILVASRHTAEIKQRILDYKMTNEKICFLQESWIPVLQNEGDTEGYVYAFDKYSDRYLENSVLFSHFGICTFSPLLIEKIKKDNDGSTYWKKKEYYDTKKEITVTSGKQRRVLDDYFVPVLSLKDTVCDYGCASGEWSRFLAPYVKKIDGYDVSSKMLEYAEKLSEKEGINNIEYIQCDAREFEINKKYDHFVMMGLLVCIENWEIVEKNVQQVSDAIIGGGYLVTRDTLNVSDHGSLFTFDKRKNYVATYHSYELYKSLFERCGFRLVCEEIFYPYFDKPFHVGCRGFVWKKDTV